MSPRGLKNEWRLGKSADATTARAYPGAGGGFWNVGMLVLRVSVWLQALEQFCPEILRAAPAVLAVLTAAAQFVCPGKTGFAANPSNFVDYGFM
jgi:mannose-1-phosphate guanylyltransferase/mannose-6-phosphate isomerase